MYYVLPFSNFLLACLSFIDYYCVLSFPIHDLTQFLFSLVSKLTNMDPSEYLQSSYSSNSGLVIPIPGTQKMVEDECDEDVEREGEEEDQESSDGVFEKRKKSSLFVVDKKASGSSGSGGVTLTPPPSSCQVDNCEADLTDSKKYHKRHKVCEVHAKAPVVVVAGSRQRFCQQCSRFHVLTEFDDTKRSCRRRLAGHNERRRKSSSESLWRELQSQRAKSVSNERSVQTS